MNLCAICGHGRRKSYVCDWCIEVVDGLQKYDVNELVVVVDGSCSGHTEHSKDHDAARAGGCIVVARRKDEVLLTVVPIELYGWHSNEIELEAAERAMMLVPGAVVWCDNEAAIRQSRDKQIDRQKLGRFTSTQPDVRWIPDRWRYPLHNLADRVANYARRRDWRSFNQLTIHRRAA